MSTTYTFIKNTEDGRKVEVIGAAICLNGIEEAFALIPLEEHPNRQAIKQAVPNASHVAGRLPLTLNEAGKVNSALMAARQDFDPSPKAVMERLRLAVIDKARMEGIE
ncbi:MAG: hypothetical protein NT159_18065 [Proteobacteria bacterium]|nr:hypothetical protein [Pseudomonadota bacterium]